MNTLIVLVAFVGAAVGSSDKVKFNFRNRATMRGLLNERVELPCMVLNVKRRHTVSWERDGQILSANDVLMGNDSRYAIEVHEATNTYMLIIKSSVASDAGNYKCILAGPRRDLLSRVFNLAILANDVSVLWRADGRCGYSDFLPLSSMSSVQAQCDGDGTYPCCSQFGWCGFSADHCDCDGCTDYSQTTGTGRCAPPFNLLGNTDFCVHYGPMLANFTRAETYCAEHSSNFLSFSSIDALREEEALAITEAIAGLNFWVHSESANEIGIFDLLMGTSQPDENLCTAVGHRDGVIYETQEDCASQNLLVPLCMKPAQEV